MKKIKYHLLILLLVLITGCSSNVNKDDLSENSGDTMIIQCSDSKTIDQQLFGEVKNGEYYKVYVFQESKWDKYGNMVWENYWKVDDLSIEEYDEMKKYSDHITYYENALNSTYKNNKIYTIQRY